MSGRVRSSRALLPSGYLPLLVDEYQKPIQKWLVKRITEVRSDVLSKAFSSPRLWVKGRRATKYVPPCRWVQGVCMDRHHSRLVHPWCPHGECGRRGSLIEELAQIQLGAQSG